MDTGTFPATQFKHANSEYGNVGFNDFDMIFLFKIK